MNVAANEHSLSPYVLLTAAYNEEANIERTIQSVLSQSLQPNRWVIVSDGSTDGTDGIICRYCREYSFIRFLRLSRTPGRSFGCKVRALQAGSRLLDGITFDFIGNLDSDISVEPSYFISLIRRFEERRTLGIGGGYVFDEMNGEFCSRRSNRPYSVAHAAQLVRRQCYEAIRGYAVLEYGGEDWHAQTCARMKGWEAEAFPDLKIFHHRRTGEGDSLLRYKFRQGRMDYALGCDPVFEILKCLERTPEAPVVLGSIARATGFVWSYASLEKRPVSEEFVAFLRKEQRQKVRSLLSGTWKPAHLQGTN
jgi:glycosyltransferase involved in cell wall biosynthesis